MCQKQSHSHLPKILTGLCSQAPTQGLHAKARKCLDTLPNQFRVAAKCNGVWGAWTAWKNFNTNVPKESIDEINFVDNSKPFLLYPNPASTNITIDTGFDIDYQIKIIDTQGRLVYSNSYKAENELINIDIAKLENGVYQLQIITNENIYLERVVVNR